MKKSEGLKEFLKTLNFGIEEKEVSNSNKEILRILEQLNAVTKHKNKFYLNDGFICGKLDISSNGTGFLLSYDKRFKNDPLIENKNLNSAHYGDIVLSKILNVKKDRVRAKVIAVLKMANETSVAYTKKFGAAILGVNITNGLSFSLKASQKSLKQLPLGTVLKIRNLDNEIIEVLGNLDDPNIDEFVSLGIYNKRYEFPKSCDNEAKSFGDEVDISLYPNRVDLRDLAFCTIDPIDAKDFDDAIFYDKLENTIYVAIADVSEYVPAFSATDKEAKFRGFSIYFPHKSIPMLPRALSENICSLRPNLDRLAFVFKMQLDSNFNVVKEELLNAVINSKMRFNYDEVDKILAKKETTVPEIQSWLLDLHELTKNLKSLRLKNGFDFRSKELRMILDENNNLKATRFEVQTPSHSLIEDCMLLANKAAAKRIKKGIFRNHDSTDLKKITKLIDDLAGLGIEAVYETNLAKMISKIQTKADELGIREEIDKLIIKSQKKAEYSSFPRGHFGLGFDLYTHFTSPIRRYSDLILHRLLKANLDNNDKLFNYLLLGIDETCSSLNVLEKEADKVAYNFMDRKFARYFAQNIGKRFKCFVSDNNGPICYAALDDDLKGARISLDNFSGEILEKVLVEITSSDIATAKITGKVVAKLDV